MNGDIVERKPNPRAERLRDLYFKSKSSVSAEFPYWYTRRWDELEGEVTIVRRAEAMKCAFSHLIPVIYPQELVVMGKTSYLRGSYPMFWLSTSCISELEDENSKDAAAAATTVAEGGGNITVSTKDVVSIAGKFGLKRDELPIMIEIAKKWKDKTIEVLGNKYERMLSNYQEKEDLMNSLICMLDSGYTVPQGREVINYYYPLQYGIGGMIEICKEFKSRTIGKPDMDRLYFYEASIKILEGIQAWILNYAKEAESMSELEDDLNERDNLLEIAERLKHISSNPPRNFRDALQLTWTIHVAVLNEDPISGMSPGRLGQILFPYWKKDFDEGSLTREETLEILECIRVKYTAIDAFASLGVVGGVTSGNTFNNISLGGLDKDGLSATNELELLILESGMTCESTQPTLTVMYDEKLPEEFLLKAVESVKTGTGYPAWVNNGVAMDFLLSNYKDEGMDSKEARAWAVGGCLETSACSWSELDFNMQKYWIPGGSAPSAGQGVHFINLPKVLELVLFNGVDMRTGKRILEPHGFDIKSDDDLKKAYHKYFSRILKVLVYANNIQIDIWRKLNPPVINSILKPDCITKGIGLGAGGCRYNSSFNVSITGGVNLINSVAAIRKNVFDDKNVSLDDYRAAIKANFGFKNAIESGSFSLKDQVKSDEFDKWKYIYKLSLNAPKFGNDDPYVDTIYKNWIEWLSKEVKNYRTVFNKPFYAYMVSVSTHGPQGSVTLATPDGRLEGTALADGSVSAYPGTDKKGPYALFNSATGWNHSLTQNTQLNMKLHPSVTKGRDGSKKLLNFIRSYMRKGGFHIQFNIVDSKVLKDAQKHPEKYRGLMVRVAGFTQYWAELGKQIQDEVISRTEYDQF